MKRLWVWLSLAFGLMTLGSIGAVALLANQYVNAGFRDFLVLSQVQEAGIDMQLAAYWGRTGGWDGVQAVFDARGRPPDPSEPAGADAAPRRPTTGIDVGRLRLTDAGGRNVYPPPAAAPPPAPRDALPEVAVPIEWQGRQVGILWVRALPADPLARPAQSFLDLVNRALLQTGLLVGGAAVLLGLALALWLSAPLRRLEEAARRIAAGDLEQRVPARGTTEQARLAQAFNDMAASLQRGEQLRRHMVSDIAHELRTPLAALQGNLQALLDGVYPLTPGEIAILHDETRALSRLVNDLYDLAQAEAGQATLQMEAVALAPLVQGVAAVFAEQARACDLRLEFCPAPTLPAVWADPARVRQVLTNLVSNAVRYTPAGGEITITLATEPAAPPARAAQRGTGAGHDRGGVRVEVTDSGPGLSPEEAAQVFERFWRTDQARSRQTGGAGLGLAIARQLVEAQGGQIGVESAPGQGSRFWFTLPMAPPVPPNRPA
jgi:signal transduction histidine kinase